MLGVTFGSKHSYNDWGIWLEDTHINPPLPKRYIVDVPARNGLLDLTPELTPTICFENRTLTFTFRVKAGDWSTLMSQIYGQIHGQTLDVVSDLDPNWHWHGCVTVDDFSSDERTGVLVITVDADPFKLSNTENSYTVNGNGTITCVVDRMEISPAFELTAPTTVIYGDSSYVIESTATTEKTLSGDIVSFADGTANPAVDLTADIEAVQSGSGDPSPENIRPISGWDEVNVFVRGINQWDEEWELGGYDANTGNPVAYTDRIRSKNFIPVLPNTRYYFCCSNIASTNNVQQRYYDANGTFIGIGSTIYYNNVFTTPNNARFLKFSTNTVYGTTYNHDISINYPSTDHDYHAYNGQTYTVNLNGTRYGGTLDVTTGVLTIDRAMVTLNGSESWTMYTSGKFYANVIAVNSAQISTTDYLTNLYKWKGNGGSTSSDINTDKSVYGQRDYGRFWVYDSAYTSVSMLTGALVSTPLQIVYPLATPQVVQLTAEQVMILKNQNNIWADSGEVEVTYLAQDFAGKKFYIPDLELTEGSHELTIQGTGTTTVTYTNGRL